MSKKEITRTPIHQARNLGPVSTEVLARVGVVTLEQLIELGWEEVALRVMAEQPRFINLNMLRALIGAIYDVDFRNVPDGELARARELIRTLKES